MSDIGKGWIFSCVIFVIIKTNSSIRVSRDKTSLTWTEASNSCGNDGLEFRESILNETDVLKGKPFWLGKAIYSQTSTWMEILGCYNVTYATGITKVTGISSIAECQIKCLPISPFYFGYKNTTFLCICSDIKPAVKTLFKYCENKRFSDAYFFYQEYLGHVLPGLGPKGSCAVLRCTGRQNNLKAVNCAYAASNVVGRCGHDKTNQLNWGKTYFESLHLCMSNNLLLLAPLNYCEIEGHKDQGIMSWTNVFREDYEIQLTKAEGKNKKPRQCLAGQLVHRDGKWEINTTKWDCDEGLDRYLCRNERTSYPMHSTATSGLTNNVELTKHQKNHGEKGNNSELVGGMIGGLLGACSIIAVSVVLIVCKIRSIGVFKRSKKHDNQETSPMQFSKTTYQDSNNTTEKRSTAPTSNETYGLAENSISVYAVVNKIKTPENIHETYTDGEYDHLHDIQNRRISPQENLYHSHGAPRNEEDQTYDSSDFGKGKCNNGNGLYGQSFSVVEEEYSYSKNKNLDNSNTMGIYDKVS